MKHLLHFYCNHLGREHLCRSDWSQWHCRCYVLVFLVCTLKLSVVTCTIQTLNTFLYTQPKETAASKLLEEDGIELDIDLGEDADVNAETALKGATTAEIVDLAGILGLHSMMNQVRPPALYKDAKVPSQTILGLKTRCRIRLCCESCRIPFENLIRYLSCPH